MSQVITNPSPKARFLSVKANVARHRELWENPQLQYSMDTALNQYQAMLTKGMGSDMGAAASVGLRMLGAQEFCTIFKLLAEEPLADHKPAVTTNLDHKA